MTDPQTVRGSDAPSTSDLVAALRDRAPRAALAIAAAQAGWPAVAWLRNKGRSLTTFTVKVPGTDDLYDDLHDWVLSLLPPGRQRALVATSSRPQHRIISDTDPVAPPVIRLRYDGSREQAVQVRGHQVRVAVLTGSHGPEERWKPPEIVFTMRTASARRALLDEIAEVLHDRHQQKRRPAFRMLDQWGDWTRLDELPQRDLTSVILPEGQIERITGDVARFLAAEADYARRAIPWHRGHLYEGPPGTGKTSVATAIAAHFGMDVWYLPLADLRKDAELVRLASRITPRSMLLLEDADVFHAATARDDDSDRVTLSGLLNSLDGLATPHGLLTVLTTNEPGVLDQAIIRPGRVDLTEHFDLADAGQVRRLVSRFYEQDVDTCGIAYLSPAEVIEACKRHDTAEAAVAELTETAGR